MGMIQALLDAVFGGGRNVIRETAEVFRVNAEAEAGRHTDRHEAALAQFAAEFAGQRRSRFDVVMDALNRIPRPAMALGTLALFVSAMVDPVWFAARMAGIALVPEPLWWLLAAVVSFYFGARHQAKGQQFQRDLADTMARAPQVAATVRAVEALRDVTPAAPDAIAEEASPDATPSLATNEATKRNAAWADNPALADWKAGR